MFQDAHSPQAWQDSGGGDVRFQLGQDWLDASALFKRWFVFQCAAQGWLGQFSEVLQLECRFLAILEGTGVEILNEKLKLLAADPRRAARARRPGR